MQRMLTRKGAYSVLSVKLPPTTRTPQPFAGDYATALNQRQKHFTMAYPLHYKQPLLITEGHLQYLWDHKGNRYLDLEGQAGANLIGHGHPAITKAIQDHADRLIHTSTIYMNQTQGALSKMILETLGPSYDSVYFCNSTGQAIDFALMLARVASSQKDLFGYRNAHHGLVGQARSFTTLGQWSSPFVDKLSCVQLPWPRPSQSSDEAIREAEEIVDCMSGKEPGLLVYEPVQTRAGIRIAPEGYSKVIGKHFQELGAVTIADQTHTGLGRLGSKFWGHAWDQSQPDIVCIGKGLGNGNALCAVATKKNVAGVVKHAWFNTYAAGHMQTRIGMAVLQTIRDEGLARNAEKLGNYLLRNLGKLSESHESLIGVRGVGLLLGVDIGKDGRHDRVQSLRLMQLAKERGLLLGAQGGNSSTLYIRPPLCITKQDAKYVVQALNDALTAL